MGDRFTAEKRFRYGVERDIVKDNETGQVAVFLDARTGRVADELNRRVGKRSHEYMWTQEIPEPVDAGPKKSDA